MENNRFQMTGIQLAYSLGRSLKYDCGGVSTHAYYEIKTKLEPHRFDEAMRKVIERQPMLHTVLYEDGTQEVLEEIPQYSSKVMDVRDKTDNEIQQIIEEYRNKVSHRIFPMGTWPMFETAFLWISDFEYELLFDIDLLVADGSSIAILIQEVLAYYNNPNVELEPITYTFQQYVGDMISKKESQAYKKDLEYWTDKVSEIPDAPQLGCVKNKDENTTFTRLRLEIEEDRWQKIKQCIADAGVTPTHLLTAAYSQVLGYWSNQSDFTINFTLSDRRKLKNNRINLIGDFTTTMPLSLKQESFNKDSILEGASYVKKEIYDTYRHMRVDGVQITSMLGKQRGVSESAFFPYVFTSMLYEGGGMDWINSIGTVEYSISQTPQVYLDCQVSESKGGLVVTWDYANNRFDKESISKMFVQFEKIILSTIYTDNTIEDILCLDENEQILLREYNSTKKEIPEYTLRKLVETAFVKYGKNACVQDEEQTLCYRQVDELSAKRAEQLRERGIGAGDFVGVSADRCVATIINILAIIRSGAAYIPINPEHPEKRREYIIKQSNCKAFMCREQIDYYVENGCNTEWRMAKADDIAYVIYTSGSTGNPKGVMISNDAVCNTILDINERFRVTEEDVFIAISSFCFDLSVYDIFGSIQAGAKMVIAPDARDVGHIVDLVRDNYVTVWNTVPAIMSLYINELDKQKKTNRMWHQNTGGLQIIDANEAELRLVMLSGDWIPLDLPEKIIGEYPNVDLYSLGGATEASIWSIYYPIEEVRKDWNSIPYGVPLANQTIHVLDCNMMPCPVDVQGEIFIGGRGVAIGYQNDSEKTNVAFINHSIFGRIYKTGDFGIMRKEGYIEFKGRKDQQVKIAGHRIELGEIEHVLKTHKNINDVVVVPCKNEYGRDYLAAYYVAIKSVSIDELKDIVKEQLPEYMIPQRWCQIETVPLSANGKVDRKSLPVIQEDTVLFIEPRNSVEKKVADIWTEILEIEKIGMRDNFFEIGGDSVSMVRISNKIEELFNIKIPLKEFLTGSTIEALAIYINEHRDVEKNFSQEKELNNISEVIRGDEFPLTDVQMAYLIGSGEQFEMGGVSAHAYYEIDTQLNISQFERALNKVIRHQPMLRAIMVDGGYQKILSQTADYEIEILDYHDMSAEEQEKGLLSLREKMSHQKFDPYTWPLFSFKVVKYSDNLQRLFIGFDLLIADGTSMRILVQELLEAYYEKASEMSELSYTFQNYIYDKHSKRDDVSYLKAKDFWREKIKDIPPAAPIIKDIDNKNFIPHFNRLAVQIEANDWQKIKDAVKKHHITPSTYLCTTFAELLAFWGNQSQHTLNVTIFNRYPFHKDVQKLIGDFTSVLLLDTDNSLHIDFWERAKVIQERMLEYIENSVYEGISVIRDLAHERSLNMAAVMPIVFTSMIFNDERFENIEDFGDIVYSVSQTPQVYLDCQVMETKNSLSITWDYVEEMFDSDMIQEMFSQFRKMIMDIDKKVQISASVSDVEIIDNYNNSLADIPSMVLGKLIKKKWDGISEKVALRCEGKSLTYKELDEASENIANKLRENSIGAGNCVGLIATRTFDTIINMIGIVKSGAAYVPINSEYPDNRRNYILNHSNCVCYLYGTDLIFIESSIRNAGGDAKPSDIAYIIYTSGSTGEPKGVVITNDAVCNTIIDVSTRFGIDEDDVFIGISSFCFDLSVFDIFGSLCNGATLVLVPDERDIPHIADLVENEGVTVWNTVPALMELYILEEQKRISRSESEVWYKRNDRKINITLDEPSLRIVMLSGDWIPLALPEQVKNCFPDAEVYSLGGATEASIWSIYYKIEHVNSVWNSIPYGYPLANQTIYILNYNQQLCPVGVIGEIYIGGRGVAKEYMNDKDKTDNAFLMHPQYGRLYRTGDYGVMTKEGYVEFKGRRDFQVKIRGHRIELGEIENVIKTYKGISKAVANVYEKNGKPNGICAYYVTENNSQDINEELLMKHCKEFLTQYMIPNYFVRLNEIPLSANGKVNKKALPLPNSTNDAVKIQPRNEVEKELYNLWCEELCISESEILGIDDTFFEMGGDSVKAIRIYSQLREKYVISIRDLFENQTIRTLSELLSNKKTNDNFISSQINEIREMYKESLKVPEIKFDHETYINKVVELFSEKMNIQKKTYSKILLTGATGYLGTHVLLELLRNTDVDVYLIIRGSNIETAIERLKKKLVFYHAEDIYSQFSKRIHILQGDLTQVCFGMQKAQYDLLSEMDCIINTAAKVTHFSSYEEMYAQNVKSVKNIVDLSQAGGQIPIYHISSSQVCSGTLKEDRQVVCGECDNVIGQSFHDFYSQTKYEAEQVLFAYKQQAAPVTIIRLGNVVFQSKTGKFQENMQENAFYSLLRVMLLVKQVPEFNVDVLEFTFVDKAAELIRLIVSNGLENCTFHAVNPNKASLNFFADSLKEEGETLKSVSYDQFLDTLEEHCKQHQDESYIQNVIANKNMLTWHKKMKVHFVSDASDMFYKKLGFEWPIVTEEMIRKMYNYAVVQGYFKSDR